ncbi:MAG: NEL domain-containing protein, partial [Paucimonas sp.]|nr:NEL domain-containing protein [Paucimonas sp.]
RISGVSEAQLRQTLMDRRRPPALLTDTLRRLMLTDASQYRALQPRLSAQGRLLARQFDLPAALVEEIVGAATVQELDTITRTARVPLRLAEEARLYQQQVRIARACEGLYQDLDANPDSARLLLHLLETLPEWPPKLRLALHEGAPEGRLLASIGPAQEPAVTLLWRGQLPQAFCQDLATAVHDLGFSDGATLREHLQAQPLPPRQRLRQWLGLPTHKPAFRSPMRLADGRLGHPLSGRPDLFITEDALLDKLRLLELEHIYPDDALVALYGKGLDRVAVNERLDGLLGEMLQLRQCMDRWVMSSASERLSTARQRSRERIGQAIWSHWRRSILPELGQPAPRLILWRVQLVDLPAQLPDFFGARVRALQLNDVMQQEGAAAAQLVDEPRLRELAQQFPSLTALDIRSGHWPAELSQAIARTWPRLRSLGLRELATPFGEHDLRALAALPRLRRLDLRGLRLGELSAMALNGLTLDFLGLDWLDLRAWPQWLDNTTLRRIGELSLVGNQLSEIPEDILAHPQARATPLRIALQGNRFSRQALLDLRIAEHFVRRFSFDLGLSTAVEQQLSGRIVERQRMQSALREWLDPATSPKALTPLQMTSRQAIGKALLKCWRDSLVEGSSATLVLEDVALDQLPGFLPPFFSERLRHLSLSRFSANDVQLERFVRQFPDLTELTLADALQAMPVVPGYLGFFTQLRRLSLLRMGLTVDQAAMRLFARLPLLSSLQLDGNQLGPITDLTLFQPRVLAFLGLSRMQIATWPAWLDGLFPTGIERLGLEDNLLSELPALLLNNRRSNVGAVEILLRGNPLSRRTMIQAHTSQHYSRPYTFVMDLPADIAAMERAAHPSDSDSEPASEGSPAVQEPPLSDGDPTSTWQTGSVQRDARNLHTWDCLVERGDAGALLKLVRLLRHSADYRSLAARPELVDRVWTVLSAADQDRELRLLLNGMAEEPLRQVHEHETCPDGIRLEFNQMEFKVYVRQALRQVDEGNRGATLFRLMRSIFRAHTLDQLARREARGRDEAEVRLAYRLSWASDLQLPLPPRSMLYRGAANVSQGELNQALRSVREAERGQALLTFAAQCDFWVAYLREVFAARFKALKDGYEAAVLGSIDAHPDEGADQSSARIGALEATFRQDEQGLLERLTRELSLTT